MPEPHEHASKPFARIMMIVNVHLDTEPTRDIPGQAIEFGYDYFAVRGVEAAALAEPGVNLHALTLIDQGGWDDTDPDGLITEALTDALRGLMPNEETP